MEQYIAVEQSAHNSQIW